MDRAPVIMLGLDACDPGIVRRLSAAGELPALAGLIESSTRCRVRNPYGVFVGALWFTLATGLRPDRHGFHCWDDIDLESYRRRLITPSLGTNAPFWKALSDAGRKIAVIDVPHAKADTELNGLQVVEWGCHDRHFGFHTWPAGRAADIASAFGLHAVLGIDAYAVRDFAADDYIHRDGRFRTAEEDGAFAQGLRTGLRAKRRLLSALLAEEEWDLFLAVFGESHAVGHQQWHLHDHTHPRFDPIAVRATGGDPIQQVYRDLDAAVGDVLSAAPRDATLLVLMSHGMGPHYDGAHLLDEVLTRIDWFDRGPPSFDGPRDFAKRTLRAAPPLVRRLASAFPVPAHLRHRLKSAIRVQDFAAPHERARQQFFLEPNNFVYGGVRLNVIGREPLGCVDPPDFDAVCDRLAEDLLALVNVHTGRPAVRAVERCDRYHRRSPTDTLPDLFVDWERSALIETVASPKIGTVHAPYLNWRTGDHRSTGLLLARGSGLSADNQLPDIDMEDIAPSVAARLGVALDDVDGSAVPWLAKLR